jgi:nicotinamidase-related amidase
MERLVPSQTLVLVVDVQERLAPAMPDAVLADLIRNTSILLDAAKQLGMRVVASEQYPKGLGPTVPALKEKLDALGVVPLPKLTFDACSDLAIARALDAAAPRSVVVVGMEAHVCVMQTVRELVKRRFDTYVVADAVASRREENRQIGLDLCVRAGATKTATETVVFDLLERAGSDDFKALSKLVK